jgi:hypothetical protein
MSVTGEKLPPARTLLGVLDAAARDTVRQGRDLVAPIVATETPRDTGKLAAAMRPRVARTAAGYSVTVRAPRGKPHDQSATMAQVARWVNRGTGMYRVGGGPKRPIRARNPLRRMTLPGGKRVFKVNGQRPNPFIGRIEQRATPRMQRLFTDGARDAARRIERTVG